ncbi:MAG: replication-associated recombination protein A [bacterium]|jgi:putative ATPase
MRPRTLDEFAGQEHLVGEGKLLRNLIVSDNMPSLILWGPPGCGKTSLANIIAEATGAQFIKLSAVTSGIKDVKEVVDKAGTHRSMFGKPTILFVDEIHRFNKAQQDAFLPHVENGTITLIGATTENPSFEVIGPLLSRCKVLVLQPLNADSIVSILQNALSETERGLGTLKIVVSDQDLHRIAQVSDGDARFALNTLELAVEIYLARHPEAKDYEPATVELTEELLKEALQEKAVRYDKEGEEHFDQISALHKAVRGSDPDGALYWLMRMLAGGEDPKYLVRRMIRMAAEDIGLADPNALVLAVAVKDAVEFVGLPECDVHLAELAIYLACAPKSNKAYLAVGTARRLIEDTGSLPVPLHIRNAPTRLMKELGYGKDYDYQHDHPGAFSPQKYLPDEIDGSVLYRPSSRGYEAKLAEKLKKLWPERYSGDSRD